MNALLSRTVPATVAMALLTGCLLPSASVAQSSPGIVATDSTARPASGGAPRLGARVLATSGDLGKIEHVLTGPDGAARQVLVRTGGVARVRSSLKALPAAALTADGGDYRTPVTREELLALPDVDAPPSAG